MDRFFAVYAFEVANFCHHAIQIKSHFPIFLRFSFNDLGYNKAKSVNGSNRQARAKQSAAGWQRIR